MDNLGDYKDTPANHSYQASGKIIVPLPSSADLEGQSQLNIVNHPPVQASAITHSHNAPPSSSNEVTPFVAEMENTKTAESTVTAITIEKISKHTHKFWRRMILSTTIIVLAAGGVSIYCLFFHTFPLKASDLISTTSSDTTFLRPKQWSVKQGEYPTYSDTRNGDIKTATGLVTIQTNQDQRVPTTWLKNDSIIALLRRQGINSLSNTQVASAFGTIGHGTCSSPSITRSTDSLETSTTIGLYYLAAECKVESQTYHLNIHGVIGMDGIRRTLILITKQNSWSQNNQVFQEMIASIRQSE